MAKVKSTSPVATRTRSKKNHIKTDTMKKTKIRLVECKVCLVRLTSQQIMNAVLNDLTVIKNKIDSDNSKSPARKYNLRNQRAQPAANIQVKTTSKNISKAVANVISPVDMTVARLWTFLKKEYSVPPAKNMYCLAKMRKYSPWPAMVLNIEGKKTEVYFFGEGTTGTVPSTEIVPFDKCKVLAKKYLQIKGYIRAIRELELTLNIPQNLSITRDV